VFVDFGGEDAVGEGVGLVLVGDGDGVVGGGGEWGDGERDEEGKRSPSGRG